MNAPLISICIPTNNRADYLEECLSSITKQFFNEEIKNQVNIFILNNQSSDNTEEVVKKFVSKYKNIRYINDSEKRKIAQGIIKVVSYADGEYVWVFSDDDCQKEGCLRSIIQAIRENNRDLIISNIDCFVEKNKIYKTNLLKESQDRLFDNRADFFSYLNSKFFNTIDYYTTFCSNWILKRSFYDKNKYIFDIYNNQSLDLFPLPSLVFYSDKEFNSEIIAECQVLFRGDNVSWGHQNQVRHLWYKGKIWSRYYRNIVKNNSSVLSNNFKIKVVLKNVFFVKEWLFVIFIIFIKKAKLYNFTRILYRKFKR